ncbi:DUF2238 domain-containing protein [Actinophytocola glycyrrhizae]|uniref:DUF2238 domain-containing protein n=1 Tax=Actinophytocola glycyrrhizae TaxID=2044873 RepID=A0ABV9S5N6_9PSEU
MTQRSRTRTRADNEPRVLLALVLVAVGVSAIAPRVYGTWLLEVAPVLLAVPILVAGYSRFRFTAVAYRALTVGALFIALGAHYSYADAPPGEWLRAWLDLDRNPYDRVGHVIQGAVSALVAREVLLRCTPLRPGRWLAVVVTGMALALSGGFEIVEAFAGAVTGNVGEVYLGTQGDALDAQWDMLCAFGGAIAVQWMFHRTHDRHLTERLPRSS